jgi:hypothetical protein
MRRKRSSLHLAGQTIFGIVSLMRNRQNKGYLHNKGKVHNKGSKIMSLKNKWLW